MRISLALIVVCSTLGACRPAAPPTITYDLHIKGGLVFDGMSQTAQNVDVFVDGDKIVFVGEGSEENLSGNTVINADGLIVAPGFIDPHTHTLADVQFGTKTRALSGYLTQGVTTVVSGNDGGGPVNVGETLDTIHKQGVGPNFALYMGHGTLRTQVMGRDNRPPTPDELTLMKAKVQTALEDGALGLSTGLYYAPASYSDMQEIIALAGVVAEFGGLYDTHIRDESSYSIGLLGAVKEALEIGRQTGVAVHIAHIKALGVDVWGQSEAVIKAIEATQKDGVSITADQYPWSASGTRISNALIPNWVKADSDEEMFARLRASEHQHRLRVEIAENLRRRGGSDAILLVARPNNAPSRTLTEEAKERDVDAIQAAIDIVLEGDSRIASFNMQEMDIERYMQRSWVLTSSDGTNGHPRKYASFPRKYRTYVHDRDTLSLAEFINRSSSLTAETLNLCHRGKLKAGYFADIVIFDPDTFGPLADFSNPTALSKGVVHLFVNGAAAINHGDLVPVLYGRPLRRNNCA